MAKKNAKPEFPLNPKKEDKKDVPEKEPKEKHPVNEKTEDQLQQKAVLQEAKTRVELLTSALAGIRAQIDAERAGGIPDLSVLQADVVRARSNWEKIQSDLNQAKGLSRKRKDEIDEWKAWYDKRSNAEKQAGLERLQSEIKWRADELASNGETINKLIPQELEARGVFEMAKQRLAAFQAGIYRLPIEKDPRLKSVLAELDTAVAVVDRLEPGRPRQK